MSNYLKSKNALDLILHWRATFNLTIRKQNLFKAMKKKDTAFKLKARKEIDDAYAMLKEEATELISATTDKAILDACGDLLFVIVQYLNTTGVNVNDLVKVIYKSNMTKLCTLDVAKASVKKYKKQNVDVSIKETGVNKKNKALYLLLDNNNKVRKPISFVSPTIEKFL